MTRSKRFSRLRCLYCKKRMRYGTCAVKVVLVEIGRNGPIETEDPLMFCSEEHAERHFCPPVTVSER